MFNKGSNKKLCPLLRKPCIQHGCQWYIHIRGTHPQTGQDIDQFDCSMVMQPLLLIENSQQQRQTAAAVESFRNETLKANAVSQRILLAAAQSHQNQQLITGDN